MAPAYVSATAEANMQNIQTAAAPLSALLPARAWIAWRAIRKPDGSIDKPPALGATSDNPNSWQTLPQAIEYLKRDDVAGLAFIVTSGIITLDFDKCRDEITGELTNEAQAELERFDSYAYVTPSHKGFRIVGANNPTTPIPGGKRNLRLPGGTKVEVFVGPTNHYNTFTHSTIDGYQTIRDISSEVLDYLQALPAHREHEPTSAIPERGMEAITKALRTIPNTTQDWDHWNRVGMAVWRSSAGSPDGMAAWEEWSAKHECHEPAACVDRWRHYFRSPPTRLGFGTLYHMARQANPLFVAPFEEWDESTSENTAEEPRTNSDEKAEPYTATLVTDEDILGIPPRQWIYGREVIAGFVSVLGSPGGVGKTAWVLEAGFSVASNRALLHLGTALPSQFKAVHKAGPVWVVNLEDPFDELKRRVKALLIHHQMRLSDLPNPVYVDSGRDRPLVITYRDERGNLIARPVVDELVAEIKRRGIILLVVDPFVQSHTAEENKNEEMNLVMALWGRVAHLGGCAVWLVHHFRKGGQSGDGEAFRGAGAIQGAARAMSTLAAMTAEEAAKLGIDVDSRKQYVRLDNAKANMAPQAERAEWYQLVSVNIGNGTPEYPEGDNVQVVVPWEPPSPWDGIGWATIRRMLERIDNGTDDGEQWAAAKQAKERWAGNVIMQMAGKTDVQAAAIIRAWEDNGVLEDGEYRSPARKNALTGCVKVNPSKAAEMMKAAGFGGDDE